MLVNKSAGIHVHFGNGSFGIPVDTVKGMLAGFTAFERCFDSIMPVHRIVGSEKQPLYGMNIEGSSYVPADHTMDFSHAYLESVSEAMAGYVDRRIKDQLEKSAPTDWAAPGQVLTTQEKASWGVVDGKGWEKVQIFECLVSTTENPAQESWSPVANAGWGTLSEAQGHPDQYSESSWDTVLTSRVPTSPVKAALNIKNLLLSYNIPSWISHLRSLQTIDDIRGKIGTVHKTSLNLEHWAVPVPGITKNTIEIRMHSGSLCSVEISS